MGTEQTAAGGDDIPAVRLLGERLVQLLGDAGETERHGLHRRPQYLLRSGRHRKCCDGPVRPIRPAWTALPGQERQEREPVHVGFHRGE